MSTNKCPPNDDACVNAGFPGSFQTEEPPCDHYGGEPCFYFHIGAGAPRDSTLIGYTHCEMPTVYEDSAPPAPGNRPCGRVVPGWYREQIVTGHWVRWGDDAHTFLQARDEFTSYDYNNSPFKSKGEPTYTIHFDPNAVLNVDACSNEPHCASNAVWIGRVKWMGGGIRWGVWCNVAARVSATDDWTGPSPPNGSPLWCRQSIFRSIRQPNAGINLGKDKGGTSFSGIRQLPYSSKGLVAILASQGRGTCFPFVNWFCFVNRCGSHEPEVDRDNRKFYCVEEGPREDSRIGGATAVLDITYSMELSTDFDAYPHRNEWERHLQNNILEFYALRSSGEVTHGVIETEPDTKTPFTWTKYETWDDDHPDGVEYPIVEYAGGVYPGKADGRKVQITGKSMLTGIQYPMELRLISASTVVELLVEKKYGDKDPVGTHKVRLFANVIVKVVCQVWLKPEAYTIPGPFRFFKDISEPWDHRFADPTNPNNVYTLDRLVVQGPNGERIHPEVTWLGRKCATPIGSGTDFVHPCSSWFSNYPTVQYGIECCSALQIIDGAVLYGQLTDMSNQSASHLFEGNVTMTVPDLNVEENQLYADCGCLD